jgi:hypothetical protein
MLFDTLPNGNVFFDFLLYCYNSKQQRPGKSLLSRAQYRAVLAPALRNWAQLALNG